jgi:ParB/RepB/Spo0J family partition protein
MTTQLQVPEVDIDLIDVVEGFNSRKGMDETELEQLATTVKAHGIVQPFSVKPKDDGRFDLTFGHRRLEAARRAGLGKVPVIPGQGNPRVEAFYENNHHAALNPIERALDTKALAEELGLTTNKAIAAVAGKDAGWVGTHLRLLKLPEGVQRYIADGTVPMDAERCLREVAKVSPRVAECVCELAKRRKIKPSQFVPYFGELLAESAEARFEERPTMIDPDAVRIGEVVTDAKKRAALLERLGAVGGDDVVIRLSEAEVDAARAAGVLVEHKVDRGEWVSTVEFITDATLAADLAERAIERIEAEAAERAKREKEWRARYSGTDPEATPEQEKQARKAKRAEAKAGQERARRFNDELGRNLLQRRGGASRKEHALARAKALVAIVLADNKTLPARGLRLVTSQLQDVEVKQLKTSGETREKVNYADSDQCREYLAKRVEEARSVNEILELAGDAVIASLLADEDELPQSKQVRCGIAAQAELERLLAPDIKSVRPRRQRRKSGK